MADGGGTRPGNGNEDPLLVRRFVLDPREAGGAEPGHTWPEPPRHVPAHRAKRSRMERIEAAEPGGPEPGIVEPGARESGPGEPGSRERARRRSGAHQRGAHQRGAVESQALVPFSAWRGTIESTATVVPGVLSDDDTAGRGPSRRRVLLIAGMVVLVAIALAAAGIAVINGGDNGPRALPIAPPPGAPFETAPGTPGTAPGSTPPAGPGQTGGQPPGVHGPAPAGPGTTNPGTPVTAAIQISPTTLAWTAQSAPPPEPRTGIIGTDGDRCLTLTGGRPHGQDRYAEVTPCDGTDGQVWTLDADGTMRLDGRCALAENTGVRITGCGRREAAQWRAGPAGILLSVSTGECLTDEGDAVLARCTGAANQRWTLP